MHGRSFLPSRVEQRRGLPSKADTAAARPVLFTPPLRTPSTHAVRLPSLTVPGPAHTSGTHRGRDVKEAAAHAAKLRYTSSLKRATRPPLCTSSPNTTTTTTTSVSEPCSPPALESVELVRAPEEREMPVLSSSSCLPPPFAQSDSPQALSTPSGLEILLEGQQYADQYLVLSAVLPATCRQRLPDDAHTMRILGYRAICSGALLRFKESAEDGMASLGIRRRLRQVGCVLSGKDDVQLFRQVDECVLRALVMSERYDDAEKVAASLRQSSEASAVDQLPAKGTSSTAATRPNGLTASMWQRSIPHIRAFRSAVATQQWREALAAGDGSAEAAACLRTSPLCAMLAFVHLEKGDPVSARALLLAYLADLPEPPTWEALTAAPSEHEQLWDSFRSHYVFSTTLLAKASVLSGSAYLNIAAALLRRCLRVLPLYAPARLLAEFVLAYEAQQEALENAIARHDHCAAILISAQMLSMPEANAVLRGEVLWARTQVQWLRGLPLEVVREASQCVVADPTCAIAFRLRADARESMHQVAEAVADRAAATRLNPTVEETFAELQTQRRTYEAAQKASESLRRSFTAFASTSPATSHRYGGSWGLRESDTGDTHAALPNGRKTHAAASGRFGKTAGMPAAEQTHYAVLGVSPQATPGDIRHRYRLLTLQCHPDRLVGAPAERRQQAGEEFARVSNAYSVLSDAQQRSDYDAALRSRF